jgi:hypothetical protein
MSQVRQKSPKSIRHTIRTIIEMQEIYYWSKTIGEINTKMLWQKNSVILA